MTGLLTHASDSLILCCINGGTSLLAGLVVFSILGHLAHVLRRSVADVVGWGVGLAFVTYPEVLSVLPLRQLWAVLLFAVLCILGGDTQICMVEGAVTAVEDLWPGVLRRRRKLLVAAMCAVAAVLGVPMVTQAGTHWLTLVDAYGASGIALLFIVTCEVVGLAWGYGAERVHADLCAALGVRVPRVWVLLWRWVAPTVCVVFLVLLVCFYEPLAYADGRPYPPWALRLGVALSCASMLCIPGYALVHLAVFEKGTLNEVDSL